MSEELMYNLILQYTSKASMYDSKAKEYESCLDGTEFKIASLSYKHKAEEYRLIASTLQEKLERGKGCEYCNDALYDDTACEDDADSLNMGVQGSTLNFYYRKNYITSFDIKNCPMCGRKLVEE